jgi:membrane protease YdiL (CAAX protease family)
MWHCRRTVARSPARVFFILAFALTWGLGGLGLLIGVWWPDTRALSTSSPLYYLAAYAVSLSGIALTWRYGGGAGLRRLVDRLTPWRSSLGWYLVAMAGYAAITAVALTAGGAPAPSWPAVGAILLTSAIRDPGPIGEEFGWRGFALPQLLERLSPAEATMRLGLLHTAWHLPLFFIPGMPQAGLSFPLFTIGVMALAVFTTAIYLRTGANLLLAILVHLLGNAGGGLAARAGRGAMDAFMLAEGAAALVVVAAGGLRRPAR